MKKLYRITALIVVVLLLSAMFCGCTPTQGDSPDTTASQAPKVSESDSGKEEIVIGFTALSLYTQFTQNMVAAMQEKADELGIKLIVTDSNYDIEVQISQVEDFIAQRVDAVILNPVDADGLVTAANACEEAKIPLILVNTMISSDNYTAYVGSSDEQAGKLAGEHAVALADGGAAKAIILHGVMGQSTQILRGDGFKKAIQVNPAIELLAEQTGNWQRDEAMTLMEDWLMRFEEIDIVFAENDEMALGAIEAIKADGRTGINVIGVDAIDEAVQAVKDGFMSATVFQDAAGQGSQSVDAAYRIVKGEKVEREILIPFITIDASNVNQYFD